MSKTKIEWAEIPNYPAYYASIYGLIKSPSKILKPIKAKDGHLYIFIHRRKEWIHRLILETFVGPCPIGMECRHLDGNPSNNSIENLKWGTRLENIDDRRRHGTLPKAHESKFTKLTPNDIPLIRYYYQLGCSSRNIASLFGTSHTTIQKINRGERWKGYE